MSQTTGRQTHNRPRMIQRAGLLSALEQAAAAKVTIIAAPAGSGKSSLLKAWAEGQDPSARLAVVQVERDQQDAQLFWLSLLRAVRQATGAPEGVEIPAAAPEFNELALVDRLLAELTESAESGHRVVVVIDDAHELNPVALGQLTRLLTVLPNGVHAILATRHDLPLRLHKLRLAGELADLRAADLRFTAEEAGELLLASGVRLSPTALAQLHERTEGWAAGLRLAAISLADHPDPEQFVAEFSGSTRTVAEYLLAEMLERQPPEVQDLLLRTSVLARVNGELADLLTGRPGSERVLLDLEDANAFVVSLDAQRTWFRYHHLFADLLRLELRRTEPGEVPALHRKAADWLAARGQAVEAVRHRQAAGDWREASALLADHSFGMMLDGQEETMHQLVQAFPRGVEYPDLSIIRAMVELVHGHLDEAAAHLVVSDARLAALPPVRRRRIEMTLASLRLSLARRRGSLADVLRDAAFVSAPAAGDSEEDIALGTDVRIVALMNLGIVEAWALERPDGARHLREGAELARKIGRPYLEVSCLAQLGFATKLPSFTVSRRHSEEAVALAEEYGWGTASIVAPALITLACVMVWMGEFDSADSTLQRAGKALQADAGPDVGTLFHLVKAMLYAGRGRLPEALAEFTAANDMQTRLADRHALTGFVLGWGIATQARLGSSADARTALDTIDAPLADSGEIRNARAVICLAEGDPASALDAVVPVLTGAAPVVHVATTVEAQLLSALAHSELDDQRKAYAAVGAALALAEPERLVLPFVMTGAGSLLATMPRRDSAHAALLTDILDVVNGAALEAPLPASSGDHGLSPTELRVLRYLPTNLSRPEIAGELWVSLNTVNTHVRNIYAKLRATDRSSAVQRARELRLLGNGAH